MKAQPQDQWRLLDLQATDTHLAQIAHRRATLESAAQLAQAQSVARRLADELVAAQIIAEDLGAEQQRADGDVEQVRARARHDEHLLDSGEISDPKQLQNLQHELQSLARRQSELEDVELEIMERVEGAQAAVRHLQAASAEAQAQVAALTTVVDAEVAALESERHSTQADRGDICASIPADLLALYDKIRSDAGSIGAAKLYRGRCEGCRLELPPNEIQMIRQAAVDEVIRCEECRCILVRTAESGL